MGSPLSIPEGDGWASRSSGRLPHDRPCRRRCGAIADSAGDDNGRWPEFGDLACSVNTSTAILDAELVVFDDDGRRGRVGAAVRRPLGASGRAPVLRRAADRRDRRDRPSLEARRRLLEQLVKPGPNWTVPAHRVGGGAELVAATAPQGLERDAKRLDSTYRPGTQSKEWRKIKTRTIVELTIGGFTAGAGNRATTFGALLVGRPTPSGLQFAGGVGTGFDQRTLESSITLMRSTSSGLPFDPVHHPRFSGEQPGSTRSCERPSRSPSSPTTASSATPFPKPPPLLSIHRSPKDALSCAPMHERAHIRAWLGLVAELAGMIGRDAALALDAADPLEHWRAEFSGSGSQPDLP